MIGQDIAAALPELRREAESRMLMAVRIESVTVSADTSTGADTETVVVVHASIPCRIKDAVRQERSADMQGVSVVVLGLVLHVPWDTAGLLSGQRAVVVSCGPLDPPALLGVAYRLASPTRGSPATAQRWGVEVWRLTT